MSKSRYRRATKEGHSERLIWIFFDDWKDARRENQDHPLGLGFYARPVWDHEIQTLGRSLWTVNAKRWHKSAVNNHGMFNENYPIRFNTAMRVIASASLPSFYMSAKFETYANNKAVEEWERYSNPDSLNYAESCLRHRNSMLIGHIYNSSPYARCTHDFISHVTVSLLRYIRLNCPSTKRLRLFFVTDHAGFITRRGWAHMDRGESSLVLRDELKYQVNLKYCHNNWSGSWFWRTFLGLVDSEVWALGRLHRLQFDDGSTFGEHLFKGSVRAHPERCTAIESVISGHARQLERKFWYSHRDAIESGSCLPATWGARNGELKYLA